MLATLKQTPSVRLLTAMALSILVLLLLAAGPARGGTIVADSGFRVNPNGFSFENYGNGGGVVNLNSVQMRRMFGTGVCLPGTGTRCVLSPTARSWMQSTNEAMDGGHCYGFAVLAELIYRSQLPRFGYSAIGNLGGGPDAFDLAIDRNVVLQRAIARAWTFQTLPSVERATVRRTPVTVLNLLRRNLNPENRESYTLAIFQPGFGGGHAITPTAIEDMGGGIFDVHVYDNNWPNDSNRRLRINAKANTWSYYAATKPNEPGALYRGNAQTRTLQAMPTLPGLGTQTCTFCIGRQGRNSRYNQISVSGSADQSSRLLITDARGRRTGLVRGRMVNQIPGARVLPRTSGGPKPSADGGLEQTADSLEPTYLIPKNLKLRIRVDGRALARPERETLNVVGPTFDSSVENLRIRPGDVSIVALSPKNQTLSVTGPANPVSPTVSFGAQTGEAAYRIRVSTPGARPGSNFFFAKKARLGLLRIASKSNGSQRYRVAITRFTSSGQAEFARSYTLRGKRIAFLYYRPRINPRGVAKIAIGDPDGRRIRVLDLRPVRAAG
jgi:hypothetical protein